MEILKNVFTYLLRYISRTSSGRRATRGDTPKEDLNPGSHRAALKSAGSSGIWEIREPVL